jgi:mannose-6-phosphate isomerase-like protein (cupin superfamily)
MEGYVLGATDGERMFNSSGEVVIKVDPTRSSKDLSLGTQLVPPGVGIPRHVRAYWDEVIYVLGGGGIVTLNDEQVPLHKDATIFVPKGVWHGFETPTRNCSSCGWPPRRGRRNFFARFRAVLANQPRIFRGSK